MPDNEISIDFVSNFMKVDRKNREKIEREKYFHPEDTEVEDHARETFIGKLFDKLNTDQDKNKSLHLEKKNSSQNSNENRDDSRIVDEIFQQLKTQG